MESWLLYFQQIEYPRSSRKRTLISRHVFRRPMLLPRVEHALESKGALDRYRRLINARAFINWNKSSSHLASPSPSPQKAPTPLNANSAISIDSRIFSPRQPPRINYGGDRRECFRWKDVRYVIRSNEWTKKRRGLITSVTMDSKGRFERRISILISLSLPLSRSRNKGGVAWKEIVIVFWRISPFVFFSFLVSQILPLGYFFPLTPFINIIRSRNTDGTIKLVLSISVGGRAW